MSSSCRLLSGPRRGVRACLLLWAVAGPAYLPIAQAEVSVKVSFAPSAAILGDTERAQIREHVHFAAQQWFRFIETTGSRRLEVEVGVADIATANGASASSAFLTRVGGRNIFEQGAISEIRTGIDPNGNEVDVRINLGLGYLRNELWFDPSPSQRSAPVPADRTDAMSVFMHEFGHALAYNGFADGQGNLPADFGSSFDRWIQAGSPPHFSGPMASSSFGAGPPLTRNNIFHWGNVLTSKQASREPLAWQASWADHAWTSSGPRPLMLEETRQVLDNAPAKATDPLQNQLMYGPFYVRGQRYFISDLDIAVLSDLAVSVGTSHIFRADFAAPGS